MKSPIQNQLNNDLMSAKIDINISDESILKTPSPNRSKDMKSFRLVNQIKLKLGRPEPSLNLARINSKDISDSESIPQQLLVDGFLKEFKLLESIGKGNQGEVFKVQDRKSLEIIAAKIYNTKEDERIYMIKKEVDILSRLNKEEIIRFKGFREDQRMGNFILLTEFVEAENLDKFILNNSVSYENQCFVISQIWNSLNYLHENSVVHGDFNLKNILICQNSYKIKLIDFGLAKKMDFDEVCGALLTPEGNFKYRAPKTDIFQNSYACDLWGFGLIVLSILMKKKISTKKVIKMFGYDDIRGSMVKEVASMVEILQSLLKAENYMDIQEVSQKIQKTF